MTRKMITSLAMLTLVVALSLVTFTVSANAQSSTKQVANIPFEFVVGDQNLSAGQYDIDRITSGGMAIRIRDTKTTTAATRLTSPIIKTKPASQGKLVFHRYGNTYFLSEVWRAGDSSGRQLVKSSRERTAERERASVASLNGGKYERVELALAR
jgi:hypothetical protein